LIQLRRPSERRIVAALDPTPPFTYAEVGSTAKLDALSARAALASRYDVDLHEFVLGTGRARFERARAALLAWRHFEVPWLKLRGAGAVAAGNVVATVVSIAGVWFVNPCRVVFVSPADEFSSEFAYGTLPGHVESGEERFRVSLDPASDRVVYQIAAFSRPAVLLSKLGYPLARRIQKRFATSSAEALARAAA
jgi:uncharacterized protein (UPF0548 family)